MRTSSARQSRDADGNAPNWNCVAGPLQPASRTLDCKHIIVFQTCINSQTAENAQTGKENSPPSILTWRDDIALKSRCVEQFIYAYRDATSAIATALIAIFTFTLWWTTSGLLGLTRSEFIATHRPRIIVRYIEWAGYTDEPQAVAFVHIVNVGVSDATIEEFGGELARRDTKEKIWLTPGADGLPKPIEHFKLISGQRHKFIVPANTPYTDQDIADDAMESIELCVFGAIRYRDGSGIARETGFFRILDSESEKFIPSKDKGEEYED